MSIGKFEQNGACYEGQINILGVAINARLEPVTAKTKEKSPDFHLINFITAERVGAAWKKTSPKKQVELLQVVFDDLPTVTLALFKAEDGSYDLVAPRRRKKQ